ncbi:major facilitator superfamily transporter [Colletotrichum falcatum]|nr:major facilitator superfamily transporter [Colletotrichum falcatum]
MDSDLEKGEAVVTRPDESHVAPEKTTRRFSFSRPPPPPPKDDLPPTPPIKDVAPRPATSSTTSTKRLSFSTTTTSTQRKLKYGTGKHSQTELSPQPTDDPDDPLNWPQWKKELNLAALMMTVGLIGGMKTAYMSVNSVLAMRFSVSYTAVASLTAVPLVISAFTGFFGLVAAKVWGKRPVYLASMFLVFIGSMWNMGSGDNFGSCMGARVFQGLGWGAFDSLILGSIHDTYFEHERNSRITAFNILSVATTWGAPLFGGLASRNAQRFTVQFDIINVFLLVVAIPLLVLGAPETAYNRLFPDDRTPTPRSSVSWTPKTLKPLGKPSIEDVKAYLGTMKPASFSGPRDLRTLLQGPRAFIAPTTLLLVLATFIPYCTLWGLAESLALLFTTMPWMLDPNGVGSFMAAPLILSVITVTGCALYRKRHADYTTVDTVCTLAGGSALAATGILAFGLTTHDAVMASSSDAFRTGGAGATLSFPTLSFLLGLLAAGVAVLDAAIRPIIWRSTQFTSSNLNVCLRNVADMDAGVACWRSLLAGVFVMAVPNAVVVWAGLKATVVGLGSTQLVFGAVMCAAWWVYDDYVKGLDGRVMGLVDLEMLKRTGSFFDTD